jgi:general secretion pathway protein L
MKDDGRSLRPLTDGATRFLEWWRDELWGLLPARVKRLISGMGSDPVLAEVEGGFQVLRSDTNPTPDGQAPETITREKALVVLVELARQQKSPIAGIRIPASRCFSRRVELPKAARADARRILNLDLERVTPFRRKDVYLAHAEEGSSVPGKIWVRQLVAKRETIDPLIADVRSSGFDIAFVDCWERDPSTSLRTNFLEPEGLAESAGLRRFITPARGLLILAILLTLTSVALAFSRYESALTELRTETSKMRERAASVRETLDRADATVGDHARLQRLKVERVSSLDVIEELSRVLPDSVWLSELRLEGSALDISGLAKSGAALPPLFAQSRILMDAALTAPLMLDPREDKERFSLRIQVRQRTSPGADEKGRKP